MVRIIELIDDFKLNQEIIGRKPKYVEMCIWRLKRWQEFMEAECDVVDVEAVEPIHIKKYVQYRQKLGNEKAIMLNNNIATLKVLRKTSGYHHYKRNKDVATLQMLFNHSAPSITLKYIGITDDEIDKTMEDFAL